MKDAQQEIKSTVTVNTSDIAAKAHEDKEQSKEIEKISKKRTSGMIERDSNYFHLYYAYIDFFFTQENLTE